MRRRPQTAVLWGAIALACVFTAAANAQTFTGRVIDTSDSAVVSGAEINIAGKRRGRTDGLGLFRISNLPIGRHAMSVRMLGYAQFSDSVDIVASMTVTRDILLVRVPHMLSQMTVRGRSLRVPAGFEGVYRRAHVSDGTLITREQIDSINPRNVTGLLDQIGFSSGGRCRTAFGRPPVVVYFNGILLGNGVAIDEVLTHMAPSAIQVVELYDGPLTVPAQFQPACSVVAVWSRIG